MSPGYSVRFLLKNRVLRYPLFRKYLLTRFFLIMALNMQTTIVVYWVYLLSNDVATVGLLGLFEAVPAIGLSFISGHLVDQWEKRKIIFICITLYLLLSGFYIFLASEQALNGLQHTQIVHLVYAGIFIGGSLRAFLSPASFSILSLLLPRKHYPNGATWASTAWQLGAIIGPLLGGLMIAFAGVLFGFGLVAVLVFVALVAILGIPAQKIVLKAKEPILQSLREGIRFVFKTQVILAALSLDMFAVLFGGATALLPAYARDILQVGEIGYGWLRAAPGIGAIITFFILANKPLKTAPGIRLLLCICGFGGSLIIFGISTHFWLSLIMLVTSGAFDAVSVVIRGTILQLYTPDEMRGRVSALNTMFISSSNELGEVESGFTAKWMGLVPAVVFGGCMTMLVAVITYFRAPALRKMKLDAKAERE